MSSREICCKQCGKSFDILNKEYNRHIKNGRAPDHFFCSLSCSCTYNNFVNQIRPPPPKLKGEFTLILKNIRNRAKDKNYENNLNESILQDLWDKQNGKCTYTGTSLIKPSYNKRKTPETASIDRIDSSRGYVANNIQFVAYSINMAKSDFDDKTFRDFLINLQLYL